MKIEEIINKLCQHEISKQDAIEQLTNITNGLRKNKALEFTVDDIGFTTPSNHAALKISLLYGYDKIKDRLKKGDKVDLIILP